MDDLPPLPPIKLNIKPESSDILVLYFFSAFLSRLTWPRNWSRSSIKPARRDLCVYNIGRKVEHQWLMNLLSGTYYYIVEV